MMIKGMKMLAEDAGGRPKNSDLKTMSKEQTSKLTKMTNEFDMEKNLSRDVIEVQLTISLLFCCLYYFDGGDGFASSDDCSLRKQTRMTMN